MALLLKDFTKIEKLGNGGMGEVFTAFQVSLKRKVVLKKMTQSRFSNHHRNEEFENWARLAASLDHDNIIHIYDFGIENGEEYITMEYVDGSDLEKLLVRKPFPREIGLMIALQALKGLHFIHQKGLIHGDFKPNNILVSKTGMVKVADFELTDIASQALSPSDDAVCFITPAYMPPEAAKRIVKLELSCNTLLETTPINAESMSAKDTFEAMNISGDIWCAGVLLYRILCDKLPFSGETFSNLFHSIINSREPDFLPYMPFLPDHLANAITSCLAKEPKSRLSSLDPLITSLEFIISEMGFRDIEKEIRKYMADNNSAIHDLEKVLLIYHANMAGKYRASGDANKEAAHDAEFNKLEQKGKYSDLPDSIIPVGSSFPIQAAGLLLNRLKIFPKIRTFLTDTPNVLLGAALDTYSFLLASRALKIVFTASIIVFVYIGTGAAVYHLMFNKDKIREAEELTSLQMVKPSTTETPPVLQAKADPANAVPPEPDPVNAVPQEPDPAIAVPQEHKSAIGLHRKTPGFSIKRKKMAVNPGTELAAVKTEKAVGLLHVYSYPWSDLYVDGVLQGTTPTPKPLEFPEGEHALQLKHQGYKPYSKTVLIQKSQITRVQINLEKSDLSER
jgi:serine/threonine protein kinase